MRFHRHNQMEMTILTRIEATIETTKVFSTKKKVRIRAITLLATATNMEVGIIGAGMDTGAVEFKYRWLAENGCG